MKKKKRRLTRKSKIIITILLLLFLLVVGGFYLLPLLKTNKIMESYSQVVKIKQDTEIYKLEENTLETREYKSSGEIKEGTVLELSDDDKTYDGYFRIKDTNQYVYYEDIEKNNTSISTDENYLDFNQNVSGNKVSLYKDGKVVIRLKTPFSLPVKEIDDEYYYVYYGNIFGVKKDEVEIYDNENNTDLESEYISVLQYDKVSDNCDSVKCVETTNFKEQLNYLKNNGYYTVDLDTYKKWLDNKIRLKEKAILLTINENTVEDILEEYGFKINIVDSSLNFVDTNKKTTKESTVGSIDRYVVTKSVDINMFTKMVNGENVTNMDLLDPNDLATDIAVINYHFFYDSSLGEECNEGICLDTKDFEEQLKYLQNNGYKTLTMEEFRAWMYGEIELPKKSVLLTIDDGAMGTGTHNGNKLIPMLEKYDMHATLFLITGWWDIGNYASPNLDIESHTNDMHTGNLCDATRGAKLLCSSKEEVIADLKKSIEITGSTTAFCFPFYAYDDNAIASVKEVGFKLAFVGGGYKASRNDNYYKIPRFPISKTTTLNEFINMVS